jgi:hypothetical protein
LYILESRGQGKPEKGGQIGRLPRLPILHKQLYMPRVYNV